MADFFSNLARQVLGAAPEVGPLLPPRFASWPGMPLADVAPRPQELADAPARADAALLPLPLIDPDGPAVDAPLPTFRQMSELRSASGPPVQPGQPPVAQDRPETVDFEQGDIRQDVATPVHPAMDGALPSAPSPASPSSPTSPASVIQAEADTDASPAPRGASGDRPSKEMATTQRDQAVPHPPSPPPASMLQPAPRPPAGQERSASSARLADPPARMDGLRHSQAEPVDGNAAPAKAEPAETQSGRVEARPEGVQWQPELVGGHSELVEARPDPVQWQPEPAQAQPEPAKARRAGMPVQPMARASASGPHTAQPAASVPAPVAQRQAVSGGQPVAPLAPQPVPATGPDLPVLTQARATPTTTAPALTTGSLEPAPPAGRAAAGWREPAIVPAPEPAPGEMGSMTRAEAGVLLRPPSARQATGEPEPTPTVRVTIGRVVVRASPAAERPPSRRVELPRPPLSLEEYLQGRQGGTR